MILTITLIIITAYPLCKTTLDTGMEIENLEESWGNILKPCLQQNKINKLTDTKNQPS